MTERIMHRLRRFRRFRRIGIFFILSILALSPCAARAADDGPQAAPASPPEIAPAQPAVTAPAASTEPAYRLVDRAALDFTLPGRAAPLPPLPAEVTRAYVVEIHGPIGMTTYDVLRRKVIELRAAGAELVIFDMDTPGGRIDAADLIIKLIRSDLREVRTVAFVHTDAISAGSWIAVNCDEIVMSPLGRIGDSAPISMEGEIKGVKREKLETYLRSSFRQGAEANGYPAAVVETMVSVHLELLHVHNARTGEHRLVDRGELRKLNAEARLAADASDDDRDTTDESDRDDDGPWVVVEVLVDKGELLTLTASEAERMGLVAATAEDLDAVEALYGVTVAPRVMSDNWSEHLVGLLTNPTITSVLVLMMIFFGYSEMHTPGFGVFGGIALACLAILMGSRLLTGLALWWEIAVFFLGVALVLVEAFVIPGFGVAGIGGVACCLVGLLAMLVNNAPDELPLPRGDLSVEFFLDSLFGVGVGFVAAVVLAMLVARFLPKLPVAGRLVLAAVPTGAMQTPVAEDSPLLRVRPGDAGVLVSDCRPAGRARVGEALLDVSTDGIFLPTGTAVRVVAVRGTHLVVEAAPSAREGEEKA